MAERRGERARAGDRHLLVALGVLDQHRDRRARRPRPRAGARRAAPRAPRRRPRPPAGRCAARAPAAAPAPGRSRRRRAAPAAAARDEREVAAHARAAQRDRQPGREQRRRRRDVLDRAAVEQPAGLAVAAHVVADRRESRPRPPRAPCRRGSPCASRRRAGSRARPTGRSVRQVARVGEGEGGMRHASAPIMAAATRAVYPEASAVHDGRLAIGGCDARRAGARVRHARLRDGGGRPARPRARVPRRAGDPPRRARRGHLRLQGVPGHRGAAACSPRRGSAATSPRAASCTSR